MPIAQDFADTRNAIEHLDRWLARFVWLERAPEFHDFPSGPRWDFPDHSPRVTEVAKAVRVIAALRASLALVDLGLTTEAATSLRAANDFTDEIIFLCEAGMKGRITADQRQFLEDFFAEPPTGVEEFQERERRRWLSRADIHKAHTRLAEETQGIDAKEHNALAEYIDTIQNEYAHGGYRTAMELYNGMTRQFETRGTTSRDNVQAHKRAIAKKVYFTMVAFWLMAFERGMHDLAVEIQAAEQVLAQSLDYSA